MTTEYELFYLVGETKDGDLPRIKEEVAKIVTNDGGTFTGPEKVEKRKLAYLVRKEVRGTFIAQRFTTPDKDAREEMISQGGEDIISRITRKLNLYRDVLRFIIVRAEELPSFDAEGKDKPTIEDQIVKEEAVKKPVKAARKPAPEKAAEPKEEPKEEGEKVMSDTDIDKKLDEVLNI